MHVGSSFLQFLRSSWGFVSTLVIAFLLKLVRIVSEQPKPQPISRLLVSSRCEQHKTGLTLNLSVH